MKRSLSLKSETLVELTANDLGAVVGGALPSGVTCPAVQCLSDQACSLTVQPRCV